VEVRERQIPISVIAMKQSALDAGGNAIMVDRQNVIDDPAARVRIAAIAGHAIVIAGSVSRPHAAERKERYSKRDDIKAPHRNDASGRCAAGNP
jgi:hypothetical protein